MRQIRPIFKREFLGYFRSPVAYVFLVAFLVISVSLAFSRYGGFFRAGVASMESYFTFFPWLFMFLVPAVGMRLWSEEKRSGTVELLFTLPVTTLEAVLGKFLAGWAFLAIAVLLSFPMALTVGYLGDPDWGVIVTTYIGAVLMAYNHFVAVRRNFPVDEKVPLAQLPRVTARAFPVLLMPFILLYGIYGGIATPTEAAAMAAAYALLLAAFYYRELTWKGLYAVTLDGARASASIGLLIGGALIFNYIVAAENIPGTVSAWLTGIEISPLAFMVAVNLLLLVLGCLLDASTIILVILPLFVPTCKALGIDLVHFGVVTVVNAMIGLITPPYGVLLFVTNAVTGIPLRTMIAEIWGFIAVLVAALFAMILFPDIVLWLPRVFGYEGR